MNTMRPFHNGQSSRRGLTLMELVAASALAVIAMLAIGQVDVTRVLLAQQVRAQGQSEAALALGHLLKHLQQADRINLISSNNVQCRIPQDAASLDASGGYRWAQYRLVGTEIRFFDDTATSCAVDARFFDINGLTILQDNNSLELSVTGPIAYTGQVMIRAGANPIVTTGLAPSGVSDPPGSCS